MKTNTLNRNTHLSTDEQRALNALYWGYHPTRGDYSQRQLASMFNTTLYRVRVAIGAPV